MFILWCKTAFHGKRKLDVQTQKFIHEKDGQHSETQWRTLCSCTDSASPADLMMLPLCCYLFSSLAASLRDFFAPSGTLQQELQLAASVSFPNQLLLEVCGNLLFDVVIFGLLSQLGICIYCRWIFWVSNLIIFWYLPVASLCYSLFTLSILLTIYLANVFRHGYCKSFYGLYATRYIRD